MVDGIKRRTNGSFLSRHLFSDGIPLSILMNILENGSPKKVTIYAKRYPKISPKPYAAGDESIFLN